MANEFMDKIFGALGLEPDTLDQETESMDAYDEVAEQAYERPVTTRRKHKTIKTTDIDMSMMLVKPKDLADAQVIIDSLKQRKPVIVNLEDNDFAQAQRVLDFVSGAVYALCGEVKEISKKIFAVIPAHVEFTTGE